MAGKRGQAAPAPWLGMRLLLAPKLLPLLPPLLLPPGLTSQMASLGLTQLMTTLGLTQKMATLGLTQQMPTLGVTQQMAMLGLYRTQHASDTSKSNAFQNAYDMCLDV